MRRPVAVVTGANRGLGLETCRQLAEKGYAVLLTSRRAEDGEPAAEALSRDGWAVGWRPLDVGDAASVEIFAAGLRAERLTVDALVNNAGVYPRRLDAASAREALAVNFLGPQRLTQALGPRFAPEACVVMVSSAMGELDGLPGALRHRFEARLDREALTRLEEVLVEEVAEGRHGGDGALAYRVTKCGLNVLTRLFAEELKGRGVRVNAVCPGWVRTDMGGAGATRVVADGAAGIVWAATLPPDGPTGGFFRDGRPLGW